MQHRLVVKVDLSLKKDLQLVQGMEAITSSTDEMHQENNFMKQAAATNGVTDTKVKKIPM